MTRREIGFIAVAVGAICSSYYGAHRATVNALRAPQARIAVAVARRDERTADSVDAAYERSRRLIAARAAVAERRRLDGLCYFDFKHAVGNKEIKHALDGWGPAMSNESGRCQLVGADSARWAPR